ncbi:MAG: Gluconolactonase [Labilithrix sp.]|nr:Gluconolactonase [Labilithrix sp.]
MTKRRLSFALGVVSSLAVGVVAACSDNSLDQEPRSNGCIGNGCYDSGASGDGATAPVDASSNVDAGPVVYGNPLEGVDPSATLVKGGFVFTEGPVWAGGHLIFSDTAQNTLFRLEDDGGAAALRNPSGGANGNAVDKQGRLVTCEGNTGRVVRADSPFTMPAVVAAQFNGKRFDAPNDVIVRSDGTIYFTDPFYAATPDGGLPQDQKAVYRVPAGATDPNTAAVRLAGTFMQPNGIAISPDETALYVVDNGAGKVLAAGLAADGTLASPFKPFVDAPGGDGMAVDKAGNVYVAAMAGVLVFDVAGKPLGTIKVAGTPSNVAFGGAGGTRLFITARTADGKVDPANGIYAITLKVPGSP